MAESLDCPQAGAPVRHRRRHQRARARRPSAWSRYCSPPAFGVGCTLSPHLHSFNERVRLNGAEAEDAVLCEAFATVEAARRQLPLTYFEFSCLAAPALLQGGPRLTWPFWRWWLGGRLDAFNIVDADGGGRHQHRSRPHGLSRCHAGGHRSGEGRVLPTGPAHPARRGHAGQRPAGGAGLRVPPAAPWSGDYGPPQPPASGIWKSMAGSSPACREVGCPWAIAPWPPLPALVVDSAFGGDRVGEAKPASGRCFRMVARALGVHSRRRAAVVGRCGPQPAGRPLLGGGNPKALAGRYCGRPVRQFGGQGQPGHFCGAARASSAIGFWSIPRAPAACPLWTWPPAALRPAALSPALCATACGWRGR